MGQFKDYLEEASANVNLGQLAQKLYDFTHDDPDGHDCWKATWEIFQRGANKSYHDDEDDDNSNRLADPSAATSYFMDSVFNCILKNEYDGTIVERANLVDELTSLTDAQRRQIYDELYENVEAGLT